MLITREMQMPRHTSCNLNQKTRSKCRRFLHLPPWIQSLFHESDKDTMMSGRFTSRSAWWERGERDWGSNLPQTLPAPAAPRRVRAYRHLEGHPPPWIPPGGLGKWHGPDPALRCTMGRELE
ncbi:hypothetical protein SEVIR_5G087350v4 [Setaria viridis]